MGYTHYWKRIKEIEREVFDLVVNDTKKLFEAIETLVAVAGPDGHGQPEIDEDQVGFNGDSECGHKRRDLGIIWPSETAAGIAESHRVGSSKQTCNDIEGGWFAGRTLQSRSCDGDCSHESFYFPRSRTPMKWEEEPGDGLYFDFCKTASNPTT